MHSSERVTVTTVMSTISHKLLFVSKRMLLFLHCLPFAGTFLVFAIEWASSACCVALFSWKAALQFVFTLQIGEFANVLTVIMCILLFKFCICV